MSAPFLIQRLTLTSTFGDKPLHNYFKIKKFEDGAVFIVIQNGFDKEVNERKSTCIVLKKDQVEELKRWL